MSLYLVILPVSSLIITWWKYVGSSNCLISWMLVESVSLISRALERWILEMRRPASVSDLSAVAASSYWRAKWQVS